MYFQQNYLEMNFVDCQIIFKIPMHFQIVVLSFILRSITILLTVVLDLLIIAYHYTEIEVTNTGQQS
jgi:hypothetical protein